MYTQILGQNKRYTDYLAFIEHISGTIFLKKNRLMYHILATKKIMIKIHTNNTIL